MLSGRKFATFETRSFNYVLLGLHRNMVAHWQNYDERRTGSDFPKEIIHERIQAPTVSLYHLFGVANFELSLEADPGTQS